MLSGIPADPAFEGSGGSPGLEGWRIEALKPARVECNGKFYSGDSYIILHTR